MIYLNIGIECNNGEKLTVGEVLLTLNNYKIIVLDSCVKQSSTEKTFVCEVDLSLFILSRKNNKCITLHQLSRDLRQDCIAIYSKITNKGFLIGPNAAKWGEFNIDYFLFPDTEKEQHYAGHSNDGSSLQKHSIGGIYPFVLVYKPMPDNGMHWGIMSPDGKEQYFKTQALAYVYAENKKVGE